jgi:enolase-phosphatase E1
MNTRLLEDGVRAILLDIEGTTTPIAFVHDTLFSFARAHVKDFLTANSNSDALRSDLALLREEHAADVSNGQHPPALESESAVESFSAYIEWLIERDRKSTGLKSLQGKIWRKGYLDGSLKSQVYSDVAPALARWHAAGFSINIFSSGSVLAQQLLFAHTDAGDLTKFIDNYFDTNVGKKGEATSYRRITEALNLEANEVVFISDVVSELDAASEAGMRTLLSLRPGNPPQDSDRHPSIRNFDSL